MKKLVLYSCVLSLSLTACGQTKGAKNISSVVTGSASCPAFETFLHDQAQVAIEEEGSLPSLDEVNTSFEESLKENYPETDEEAIQRLTDKFSFFYAFLFEETDLLNSPQEKTSFLTKLEMGTHEDTAIQAEYDQRIKSYSDDAKEVFTTCIEPKDNPDIIPPEEEQEEDDDENVVGADSGNHQHSYGDGEYLRAIEEATGLAVYGALKTFATAYQSCDAISLSALGDRDPAMEGIVIRGTHSSGRGKKRYIGSLSKIQRSHPYIQSVADQNTCFDTFKNPLIYDFGGKPHSTSASSSKLNFFKDDGTGTSELGTDCSGFIYSSLMTAGLKLAPNKPPRARGVVAYNARAFKDLGSRMACFSKVKAGKDQNLKAGDILASGGHIFIVDWAGEDPLGANDKRSNAACDTITHKDFDFTIMQSSPSKGAIGMNRMIVSDYLDGSSSMRKAMISFARTHCKQKLAGRVMTPNHSSASLIRHKMTPECISNDRIRLVGESCLNSCSF